MKTSIVSAMFVAMTFAIPVWAQAVDAQPDAGTANAGVGSKPIANVLANDTVDGAAAVLGSSGNATVSKSGGWPSGLGLNLSTGAVTTTIAVPVGQYNMQYQLCDKSAPANCTTAAVTVNVITASVIANADSGTAAAGIASRPIANVASNDSVNGNSVTLGASGNATVAKFGTWPAGIGFTPSTGAVNTTIGLPDGEYSVQYQLCDRNAPPLCATAMDTITVIVPSIAANADSGAAAAGIAGKPIKNVAANDTVHGLPATLGSSGNSKVSQVGAWPSGVALTPSTGAISTTAAVMPGTFNLQYQLCDLNAPPVCATGNATVSVTASIVTVADAGWAVVGNTTTVIPNVTANDSVNNAPVTLGASGNASISEVGSWPIGLSLDPSVGAVSVTSLVQPAAYQLQYQLCDQNPAPNCNVGSATVHITPVYDETQATTAPIGDIEFDWGRDGILCPTCNFGNGNARANWTDRQGNIWVSDLDPNTGQFIAPGANDEQVDPGKANAFFWNTYGNGPEWAFSTQNGEVVSQLVYSRYAVNDPKPNPATTSAPGYTGAALATQTGFNTWVTGFLPGAINGGNGNPGTNNSNLPEGSQCNSDPVATVMYKNFANPIQMFTEPVSSAPGTVRTLLPFTSNGIGERFVPCTRQLLFQASAPFGTFTFQQVFWYNMDTGVVRQLTNDATTKYGGFMFRAPDFGGDYIFFTLSNRLTLQVYRQTGTNGDGSPAFTLVNQITSPDPKQPYMNSAEPFIMCTPTCTTYVTATVAKNANAQNGITEPNGLAVIALSPDTPMFNILVAASAWPFRQRLDPEYFITPNGAYLYYNQIVPQTGSTTYRNQGEWFIDMQLGTPSGPCVGSSAQGGLMPGC